MNDDEKFLMMFGLAMLLEHLRAMRALRAYEVVACSKKTKKKTKKKKTKTTKKKSKKAIPKNRSKQKVGSGPVRTRAGTLRGEKFEN